MCRLKLVLPGGGRVAWVGSVLLIRLSALVPKCKGVGVELVLVLLRGRSGMDYAQLVVTEGYLALVLLWDRLESGLSTVDRWIDR